MPCARNCGAPRPSSAIFFASASKALDEQAADRLALDLGVVDALERVEKQLLRLHMAQRDIVVVAKQAHDLLGLALAQQPVIDEDAGQRVADGLVNQHGGDGAVDAARKAAEHAPLPDLLLDRARGLAAEGRHGPVGLEPGDLVQEIRDQLRAVGRMHDFEVELHAVEAALFVGDAGVGRVLGLADDLKAGRQARHAVAVAHPDLMAPADRPDPVEERALRHDLEIGAAEFAVVAGLDLAAELLGHKLLAVADGQNRNARLEDRLRRARRASIRDRAGPAREDHGLGSRLGEGFRGPLETARSRNRLPPRAPAVR